MLQAENIDVYYGASHILRGASIGAAVGKVTCLLGRNGVGKSTMLRGLTGQDEEVVEFLDSHAIVRRFVADIATLLQHWIPEFKKSNRSYLTVAIGCTGGQHRSVYVVEKLADHFGTDHLRILFRHSELAG